MHTNTPINGGDKWRGVKIHRCLPLLPPPPSSPPQPPNIAPDSPSKLTLWHSHFSVTLLLLLLLLLLSVSEECVSLTTSFPSSPHASSATQAPSNVSFLSLLPLSFGCFGFLCVSLCVYFCSVCANRWGRVSEGSLFPLFSASAGNFDTRPSARRTKKKEMFES